MPDKKEVSSLVREQVHNVLNDLLNEPIPPYAVLGVELVVHAGLIKRIKTKREIQIEAKEE